MSAGNGIWVDVDELISLKAYSGNIFRRNEKKSSSPMSGGYTSPFRGRGIDFSEVRAYLPGDDIRAMDWRVTARTGKPHTKLFIEERERPVFFLCDFSSSMFFATRTAFKSVVLSRAVSLLAWAASGHGDRVGGCVFSEEEFQLYKPLGGKRGVLQLVKALSSRSQAIPEKFSDHPADLEKVIRRVKHAIRPGSLLYVLSDFRCMSPNSERLISEVARHCDVVSVLISDPSEIYAPSNNTLKISNGESFGSIDTSNSTVRTRLDQIAAQRISRLSQFCISHGIHAVHLLTSDKIEEKLRTGLSHKQSLSSLDLR